VFPHRQRLLNDLEQRQRAALADAENAEPYSRKQLMRYVEQIGVQITLIKSWGDRKDLK